MRQSTPTAESRSTGSSSSKKKSGFARFVVRLFREKPLGAVGAVITVVLLVVAIFANILAPYGMNQVGAGTSLQGPTTAHLLGTDNLGRDLLSRVIFGARISVIVGLSATTMGTLIATLLGMISGYVGGAFDLVMQRIVDAWLTFPGLLVLMVLMSITGPGMIPIIVVLGITTGVASTRIIRGATMSAKENVYVQASIAIGCTPARILLRHILPNIMAPIIILFSTLVPYTILSEAMLSFLGLGIPAPAASWGGMLSGNGLQYMFMNPWMAIWPGLALSITVYAVNIFGDAVRDLLDPRLKGGVGRYDMGVVKPKKGGSLPADKLSPSIAAAGAGELRSGSDAGEGTS